MKDKIVCNTCGGKLEIEDIKHYQEGVMDYDISVSSDGYAEYQLDETDVMGRSGFFCGLCSANLPQIDEGVIVEIYGEKKMRKAFYDDFFIKIIAIIWVGFGGDVDKFRRLRSKIEEQIEKVQLEEEE